MQEGCCQNPGNNQMEEGIQLPDPCRRGKTSVEQALHSRRSIREYKDEPLSIAEIAQIFWAAQGISEGAGELSDFRPQGRLRTAPSAGALYPLEVYVVAGWVAGLEKGIH
jgi:nitroreductase